MHVPIIRVNSKNRAKYAAQCARQKSRCHAGDAGRHVYAKCTNPCLRMHLFGQELCGKQRGAGLQGAARRQSETHKANRFRHKKQHSAGKQPLCAHLPIQRGVHCAECAALYPKKPYDTRRAKAGKRKQQQQRKAQKRRKQRRGKHLPKRAGASDAQKFGRVIRNKIPLLPSKCGRTQPGAQQDAGHQAKSKQRDASAFSAPSPLGHAKIFDCAPGPKRWPMAAKRKLVHRAHILFLFNRFYTKPKFKNQKENLYAAVWQFCAL